ncbi:MAG TPA: ABC transporter ATP-binding protein/permease [Clostridiales bacterium]|nr:ABC transporter ATP-binding protein/permease [Clostridiales bacterium]HOL91352.1 ABC transporter ATP-binding protein/permease [Clostridiales bacterium]
MLELKNITKTYHTAGEDVEALKGIDLQFRNSEFVCILGPSGCGKTTLLNIIGGLDSYTSGDLIINGRSTKEYKDRDWDAYRNHSVGFVFQSYNLIPHQTVLSNVEIALTLTGVPKKERRQRAREALEKVGLGDQLRKKPAQLSGGQMQRVAIARAIVNNPDIIMADEPTGALDTETSRQVMDILKEIARDRLVIMVTHNPVLAERYSTRIVKMLDGRIIDDSQPLTDEEYRKELDEAKKKKTETHKKKMPSMSFLTSFGLSLKNLFTKKGRTALTSFAGSIGIIGIALIYAVSKGTTAFIDSVQEDTLASYPLTIEAQSVDMSSLISTFLGKAKSVSEHEDDAVYQKAMIYEMMNSMNSLDTQKNDLKAFKEYIEAQRADENSKLHSALSGVQYSYDLDLMIYTKNVDGSIIRSDRQTILTEVMKKYAKMDMSTMLALREQTVMGRTDSLMKQSMGLWKELVPGDSGKPVNSVTEKQYDIIYGRWPSRYDELVLFVDENNEIDDLTLYTLGLLSEKEIEILMDAALNKKTVDYEIRKWSYEDICNMDFRTILNCDCYTYDEKTGTYTDLRETEAGLKYLYDNALKLRVVGIAKPDEDAISPMTNASIGYTYMLTDYIIDKANESDAVKAQLADPSTDIFTGLPFRSTSGDQTESSRADEFRNYVSSLDTAGKAEAYKKIMSIPSEEAVQEFVSGTLAGMTRADMEKAIAPAMAEQTGMDEETIAGYIASMSDEDLSELLVKGLEEQFRAQYAAEAAKQMSAMSGEQLAAALDMTLEQFTDEQCAAYYDELVVFSDSTYEDNLLRLGLVDRGSPAAINLYASSFANKDVIEEVIAEYNESVDDLKEIKYTDYVGLIMSSVTTIINAITYVLIAFVAVSLIVSSIMIGVITLISVQERTKEIGILRAIGASKGNVSSLFNAETVIIGFTSGLLGVLITYLLCIPINMILHHLTGLSNLSAFLPPEVAVMLVVISMLLTLIAGIIPSRSAAKKDPVVALRTE